jgi:2-keto-4-pentenoate hydratase
LSDAVVVAGLRRQLRSWRESLDGGAARIGWKIGLNIPEVQRRLGLTEPVIGHLTSATQLASGDSFDAAQTSALHVEPELALEIGDDGRSVAGYAAAIELVDLDRPPSQVDDIVAGNVFHRGFVLGESRPELPEDLVASVEVNGATRDRGAASSDFAEVVDVVARRLDSVGETLRAGDRIIAGAITAPVPVAAGDRAAVDLGSLGRLEVRVA